MVMVSGEYRFAGDVFRARVTTGLPANGMELAHQQAALSPHQHPLHLQRAVLDGRVGRGRARGVCGRGPVAIALAVGDGSPVICQHVQPASAWGRGRVDGQISPYLQGTTRRLWPTRICASKQEQAVHTATNAHRCCHLEEYRTTRVSRTLKRRLALRSCQRSS